jgi:hypothetical protein
MGITWDKVPPQSGPVNRTRNPCVPDHKVLDLKGLRPRVPKIWGSAFQECRMTGLSITRLENLIWS